jgi:uroporphyrinogen-III synthase
MHRPVVITRPSGQADTLARRIAAIGREPIVFPLLEIQALHDPVALKAALSCLADFAMVAFVSPNAIDATCALRPEWPPHIMFAVMGEGSRNALARHGITPANATIVSPGNPARTDSGTLLEALDLNRLKGRRVLVIRGESGREFLADRLREAGVDVTQVPAYRRVVPELDAAGRERLAAMIAASCDWIITSSEALRILLGMALQTAGPQGVARLQQQRLVVPHQRIEETARLSGFHNVTLTGSGDDNLLAAIQS